MDQGNVAVDSKIEQLVRAVQRGNVKAVRKLLSDGVDSNGRNAKQETPLVLATHSASPKIVKLLLQYGARLEDRDGEGWTALGVASLGGNWKVVKLLLNSGANPNAARVYQGSCCGNPLTAAISKKDLRVIRLLLDHGADVNAKCIGGGYTPLEFAVTAGYLEPFKLLMEKDPTILTKHRAICFAAGTDRVDMLEWLLRKGVDPNAVKVGEPPLVSAAKFGHLTVVVLLLRHGADPNTVDKAGWTPLRHAVTNGHEEVATVLKSFGGRE